MKLLFDQNLSHRLVSLLRDIYPNCEHVRDVNLIAASDTLVWEYARTNGFMIISKDADFHQRSLLYGYPPKVVWVKLGNCSTKAVEALLRAHAVTIERFEADRAAAFLILS